MSQGPPIPSYIFRGHASPVHALHFFAGNAHLVSGDSDGWVVIWSLATKRPLAVWKAHDGGIMGLRDWQGHKLISHGRDHKLRVWQLRLEDYEGMSIRLPVDGSDGAEAKHPWLLHSLSINALNYCAFSTCEGTRDGRMNEKDQRDVSLLLAAPNGLDAGGIDIFHLPSENRVCKMPSDKETQTGMVMALNLFRHPTTQKLSLASGYETGHILLHTKKDDAGQIWSWMKTMTIQPHSQPVLSLDVTPNHEQFFSSSADAIIAKCNVDQSRLDKRTDTKHAGQQDLKIRDDGRIFATAGWDKRVRIYSTKTMKELAVLKWHQEGCSSTAFATTIAEATSTNQKANEHALITTAVDMLRNERATKAQNVHWLAAGGKDGKISLWDIY